MLEVVNQSFLIAAFDCNQLFKRSVIINIFFETFELCQILFPAVTDSFCDEVGKLWVSVQKPAALSDTVCLVVEFLWIKIVPVFELLIFEQFSVKFCNTVYAETSMNCKPCHVDFSVMDDRHVILLFVVVRIFCTKLNHETTVDFFNNLIDSRKQALEDCNIPLFKSLSEDCVVCVSECFLNDFPS